MQWPFITALVRTDGAPAIAAGALRQTLRPSIAISRPT